MHAELPPAWGHVLKPARSGVGINGIRVAPRVGACIETEDGGGDLRWDEVAPRVGACIETRRAPLRLPQSAGCPPRGGMY